MFEVQIRDNKNINLEDLTNGQLYIYSAKNWGCLESRLYKAWKRGMWDQCVHLHDAIQYSTWQPSKKGLSALQQL